MAPLTKTLPFPKKITNKYCVIRDIECDGPYGELVRMRDKKTDALVTVKNVRKTAKRMKQIKTIIIHPHFVRMKGWVPKDESCFIVSEYEMGGDLASKTGAAGRISEDLAKFYFYQVALALKHLHKHVGMPHCNLKPENILLCSAQQELCLVKLSDHGFTRADPDRSGRKKLTTSYYAAPEVRAKKGSSIHSFQADMWSLGAVMFKCLTGKYQRARVDLKMEDFPAACRLSTLVKDLIQKLMLKAPSCRLDADGVLGHEWLQDDKVQKRVECLTSLWREKHGIPEAVATEESNNPDVPEAELTDVSDVSDAEPTDASDALQKNLYVPKVGGPTFKLPEMCKPLSEKSQ